MPLSVNLTTNGKKLPDRQLTEGGLNLAIDNGIAGSDIAAKLGLGQPMTPKGGIPQILPLPHQPQNHGDVVRTIHAFAQPFMDWIMTVAVLWQSCITMIVCDRAQAVSHSSIDPIAFDHTLSAL